MAYLKKVLILLMMGAIMMANTGCEKMVSHEELAVQLLNEKYNEEFEIEKLLRQYIWDGYYTAVAYPADNPDILFKVSVNSDGSGISDNYVDKLIGLQLSDKLAQNLDGLNGEFMLYCKPAIEAGWLTDVNMTLEEYEKEIPAADFRVYMFYCHESLDKESLYKSMNTLYDGIVNMSSRVYLYVVDENDLQNICGYIQSHDDIYDDFDNISEQGYKGYINYSDNKMTIDESEFMKMME